MRFYGNLIVKYPKPYSIYLRGTIVLGLYWGLYSGVSSVLGGPRNKASSIFRSILWCVIYGTCHVGFVVSCLGCRVG